MRRFGGPGAPPAHVLWDGKDETGLPVADGVYTYRLNITDKAGHQLASAIHRVEISTGGPQGSVPRHHRAVSTRRLVMDRTIVLRRGVVAALLLAASLSPQAAHAGKKSQPADNEKASTLSLNEVGRAFESARLLSGADRVSALARLDESTEALLRGNVTADQRTAVLYLSASSALPTAATSRAPRTPIGASSRRTTTTRASTTMPSSPRSRPWRPRAATPRPRTNGKSGRRRIRRAR